MASSWEARHRLAQSGTTCGKRNFMHNAFCRACGEQPTKTQKQHGAGGTGRDGGASLRQAPPRSATQSARELGRPSRCTTNWGRTGQCNSDSCQENRRTGKATRTSGTRTGETKQATNRSNGSGQQSVNAEGGNAYSRSHTRRTFPNASTSKKLSRDWQR